MDQQTISFAVGIAVGFVVIVGGLYGGWRWLSGVLSRRQSRAPTVHIPKKTVILQHLLRPNSLWWTMGSSGDQPAMQISGDLMVTNVTEHTVLISSAKLKKPNSLGHVLVRTHQEAERVNAISPRDVCELRFGFWVMPPVAHEGEQFVGDVAILDQFGNEHWVKGIQFEYL